KTIKGGKSPQNKEKRFTFTVNDTPGPGTYCQPPSLSPEDSKTKRQLKVPSARGIGKEVQGGMVTEFYQTLDEGNPS
ncbi:hypothetical protein E2320_007531, partial [Naja naja]